MNTLNLDPEDYDIPNHVRPSLDAWINTLSASSPRRPAKEVSDKQKSMRSHAMRFFRTQMPDFARDLERLFPELRKVKPPEDN